MDYSYAQNHIDSYTQPAHAALCLMHKLCTLTSSQNQRCRQTSLPFLTRDCTTVDLASRKSVPLSTRQGALLWKRSH